MVLRADRTTARVLGIGRFCLLAFVALLVAHDAVYLAQHELGHLIGVMPERSMTEHAGHWPIMSTAATISGGMLFAWAVANFGRLRLAARRRAFHRRRTSSPYRPEFVRLWTILYPAVVLAYVVLENVEHVAHDGTAIWFGALAGPDHAFALPVLVLVTGLMAALGALIRWRIALLREQIAAAGPGPSRPRPAVERPVALWWVVAATCAHTWILARCDAGRAPPNLLRA